MVFVDAITILRGYRVLLGILSGEGIRSFKSRYTISSLLNVVYIIIVFDMTSVSNFTIVN